MKKIIAIGIMLAFALAGMMTVAPTATAHSNKPWICHPVNGKGELGNGWNLINPDKASSHIDESKYPNGHYWKHESNDGLRHDRYAENGKCPGPPISDFDPYEVHVCWEVDNWEPGDDNWPQTRSSCDYPDPECGDSHRYQSDYYWIRDQADEDYLASLTHLNSSADDRSLEPHNWSIDTVLALPVKDCMPKPEPKVEKRKRTTPQDCTNRTVTTTMEQREKTPVWNEQSQSWVYSAWTAWHVIKQNTVNNALFPCVKHTKAHLKVVDKCGCRRDVVKAWGDHVTTKVKRLSPTKFRVTVKADKNFVFRAHRDGTGNWVNSAVWNVHTTKKICQCVRDHTCHKEHPNAVHHQPCGRLSRCVA